MSGTQGDPKTGESLRLCSTLRNPSGWDPRTLMMDRKGKVEPVIGGSPNGEMVERRSQPRLRDGLRSPVLRLCSSTRTVGHRLGWFPCVVHDRQVDPEPE